MGLKNWVEPFSGTEKMRGEQGGAAGTEPVGAEESRGPRWMLLLEMIGGNPRRGVSRRDIREKSGWEKEMTPSHVRVANVLGPPGAPAGGPDPSGFSDTLASVLGEATGVPFRIILLNTENKSIRAPCAIAIVIKILKIRCTVAVASSSGGFGNVHSSKVMTSKNNILRYYNICIAVRKYL